MEKRSRDIRIIQHGLWVLAGCKEIYFGKGALLVLVACILVLGTASAAFSVPAVGALYYLECKVYVMSNFQEFLTTTAGPNWYIFAPVFNEETNMISYQSLGLNTNRESLYFHYSQIPMGRIYYWHGSHGSSQKRWDVWQALNHNYAFRKSEFHAFEASASSWAGAVLPFGSDPNEIFPNGCSDLPSQQPDQIPNLDTGRPECNDQIL